MSLAIVGPASLPLAGQTTNDLGQASGTNSSEDPKPRFWTRLPDLRAGPFDFNPRLTTSAVYDDNILISSKDQQTDVIWSVQPAVKVVAGDRATMTEYRLLGYDAMYLSPGTFITLPIERWPGKLLMLDYGAKFNWFTEHSVNDSTDHLGQFNALWPLAKAIIGCQQGYRLENTTIIEAGRRSQQETITTAILSGYQFSEKTSAELNLRRTSMDYEVKDLTGNTDWSNDNWFNYQATPLLNVGAGVTLGTLRVADQAQTYEQLLTRARYQLAERVIVGVAFGGEARQFEKGVQTLEPLFNLEATYRPLDQTTLGVFAYRRDLASAFSGYNYILTGISGVARQRLGDRFTLSFGGGFDNYSYLSHDANQSGGQSDDYFQARSGLDVQFTRHLQGSLYHLFRTVSSNRRAGFDNQQLGLQFVLTY